MTSSLPITTALLKQDSASSSIQFSTDNKTWTNITSWPFTIGNKTPDSNILKVKFNTDITLPIVTTDYFILTSSNIIIDGNNKTVTVNNFPKFPGFITNGSSSSNGNNNITIQNISVVSTGTTALLSGQGWICKNYFGKGSTGNIINNCSSSGPIPANSGGITGQYTAINSTNFAISACSASGSILDGAAGANAGGIVGANSGSFSTTFTITTCTYSGDINGNGSGGIIGAKSTNVAITFCSSSGIIKGGGIAGDYVGVVTAANNLMVNISDCFSKGDIGSTLNTTGATSAGGIIGAYGGVVNITRCYSIGVIGGDGKNDCGGIVGGYAGLSLGLANNIYTANSGAVVVQSCFSCGNIYTSCGGIAGKYFGNNVFRGCNVYDSYSLGDIGDSAGGIVGPEFAAGALTVCRINRCYSLGQFMYATSGGIIGPTTVTYPTTTVVSPTVNISKCFNSFNIGNSINSIVGSGFGPSIAGIPNSTFPARQGTDQGQLINFDNTVTNVTYGSNINSASIGSIATNFSAIATTFRAEWYFLQSSTNSKIIVRLVNGYYCITPDIIGLIPFSKIDLLGFPVSDFLLNARLSANDLITYNINLTSTVAEFTKANVTLSNLFTNNVTLDVIQKIGYTISQVLAIRPSTTFKEFIDAGYNYKTQKYTISAMLATVPTLTPSDFAKAGFNSLDLKTSGKFTLLQMKLSGLGVAFLKGTYTNSELKDIGFNASDFRQGGVDATILYYDLGFKEMEFQGSKYSVFALTRGMSRAIKTASGTTFDNRPFSNETLIALGYKSSQLVTQSINYEFNSDPPMKTYAKYNVSASDIPKDTIITNIKDYPSTMLGAYLPQSFLNCGWTKRQVGLMGFTARALLDANFSLSDLKTIGYSDSNILASGHASATQANLSTAIVYTAQPPPMFTDVITDDGNMYIYFKTVYSSTAQDITGFGYSFDNGETYTIIDQVTSPLMIENVDFTKANTIYLATYNGLEFGNTNYIYYSEYIQPILGRPKYGSLKFSQTVMTIVAQQIIIQAYMNGPGKILMPGFSSSDGMGGYSTAANKNASDFINGKMLLKDGFWTATNPLTLGNLITTPSNSSNNSFTTSKMYGSKYAITNNTIFLTSVPTITSINTTIDLGVVKVYFTNIIKNSENITNYHYSIDGGVTWNPTNQTTSPLTIGGLFVGDTITICIRAYSKTTFKNTKKETALIGNFRYSERMGTSALAAEGNIPSVTNPVNIGKWSNVSNSSTVTTNYSALTPSIFYIYYDSRKGGTATIYFDQLINCSGPITDYYYSIDNGNTWVPLGLNLTQIPPKLSNNALGFSDTVKINNTIRSINITGLNTKQTSYTIMLRSFNGMLSPASNSVKSDAKGMSDYIVEHPVWYTT